MDKTPMFEKYMYVRGDESEIISIHSVCNILAEIFLGAISQVDAMHLLS